MARTRHTARLNVECMEDRAVPAAGALDPSFGINGQTYIATPQTGVPSPIEVAYASAVQSDGKIIMVGTVGQNINGPNQYLSGSPSPDFAAVRLNVNGSIDTTFGVNGFARVPFDVGTGSQADAAYSVGIQSDGHIVLSGYAAALAGQSPSQQYDWAVTRLNTDGSLDKSFGTNGLVTFALAGSVTGIFPTDMVITGNDYITMVGRVDVAAQSSFELARLTPRGQPDPFFGSGGVLGTGQASFTNLTPINGGATSFTAGLFDHIANGPGGSVYVAGNLANRAGDFVVAKITSAGTLDTSFGVLNIPGTAHTGFAFANLNPIDPLTGFPGPFNGIVGDVTVDPSGNILVTGRGNGDFITVRFTPAGVLDTTFGVKGVSTVPFNIGGGNVDTAEAIAVQPNGKIVLVGEAQTGTAAGPVYAVARLTSSGVLDTTFGVGGKETFAVNNPTGSVLGIAAHSVNFTTGGKILVVGQNNSQMVALQLLNDVSFNPLPPPPAPPPTSPPPIPSPGTRINQLAMGAEGPGLVYTQAPVEPSFLYDPAAISNLTSQGAMLFFTQGFTGSIRTAVGDVNGDGTPDIAVATGPGTPTRWAVISGANPNQFLVQPIPAFGGSEDFTGGAYVSVGDFTSDGKAEIVISADQGGGPRVTIYAYSPTLPPPAQANFFAIADTNFRGGVRTAVGDINGDGVPDLAVAAGIGGGPRIALFDGTTVLTTQAKLTGDFFAFDTSLRDGAYVAIGDVNGDGFGDLIYGAGDGGAPRVLVVSGQKLLEGTQAAFTTPIASFFVGGDTTSRGGVRVAVKNVDGDAKADIVAGSGDNQFSRVRIYKGASVGKGEPTSFQDLNPFNAVLADGVYVG